MVGDNGCHRYRAAVGGPCHEHPKLGRLVVRVWDPIGVIEPKSTQRTCVMTVDRGLWCIEAMVSGCHIEAKHDLDKIDDSTRVALR